MVAADHPVPGETDRYPLPQPMQAEALSRWVRAWTTTTGPVESTAVITTGAR